MRRPNQYILRQNYEQAALGFKHNFYILSDKEGKLIERILDSLTSEDVTPDPKDLLELIEYRRQHYPAEGNCDCCGKEIESIGEAAYIEQNRYRAYDDPDPQEPLACSARCEYQLFHSIAVPAALAQVIATCNPGPLWFEVEAIVTSNELAAVSNVQLLDACTVLKQAPVFELCQHATNILSGYAKNICDTHRMAQAHIAVVLRSTKELAYTVWQIELRGIRQATADRHFTLTECPACSGTGYKICTNPDHGPGGDQSALGCPICGHDELCRTSEPCSYCEGQGTFAVYNYAAPAYVLIDEEIDGRVIVNDDSGETRYSGRVHFGEEHLVSYVNASDIIKIVGHRIR